MSRSKEEEFVRLEQQIKQWNIDHFDLFELSQPNENLEFHGVIRFYFQDEGQKVSTKCVRVSSTASTQEVVDVLVEKFRPDMRMLTPTSYSLYEVHVNGEERKLTTGEKPLLVQLNWGKDVREGRFLLKRDTDATIPKEQEVFELEGEMKGFKRKLSRREKKEKKKRDKERIKNKENFGQDLDYPGGDKSLAAKHYNELPETSFTRSISNPEAVMRRRRQQKLEKKLEQIRNQGPNSAGTLKIYGESLKPDVPYKTLLLSSSDPVWYVIKETLEKYGLEKENPKEYCLVQVSIGYDEREYHGGKMGDERRLELDECPLSIAMQHPPSKGTLMFEIRRKTVDEKKKAKALRAVSHEELRYSEEHSKKSPEKLPYLQQLFPDGSENPRGRRHRLQLNVTEVGSDPNAISNTAVLIPDRAIQPRHCVLAHTDGGIVTVTPNSQEAETYVNGLRIYETTILKNGMTVAFGRNNLFKFVHPNEHDRQQKAQFAEDLAALQKKAKLDDRPHEKKPPPNFNETTFDLDGHVETRSQQQFDRPPIIEDMQTRSMSQKDLHMGEQPGPLEDALPVALEFKESAEDNFLDALISDVNGANVSFKLAPTYTVYMAVRYRLSMMYRPDMSPTERANRLTSLINKVAKLVQQAIQDQHDNPSAMSFWMANASELLHFCKQDHDVHPFSQDAQEVLAESVQIAFHHLVRCLQHDLQGVMVAFLDENDDREEDDFAEDTLTRRYKGRPVLGDVLNTLSSAMHLLRRCRVNAALTIQLFSQLFHFINMSLFNTLVTQPQMRLCTMKWGIRLKRRLGRVEAWAEKQGLELAADCHLCRIIQAAHLLQAPKSSPDHIAYISSTCFKLNSLQLRTLLEKYIPEPGEPPIPQTLIEKVVAVAENMADELTRTDGRDIQLEEDPDLQLPFLLPEDGYSCDLIRGVPNGLLEFLEPLSRSGLCRAMVQDEAVGDWTVYMVGDDMTLMQNANQKGAPPGSTKPQSPGPGHPPLNKDPEQLHVTFNKVKGSMGLSIVAARGETQDNSGIYIKSVVPGGAAALDGRLTAGDQLLEVDGKSLVGLSQEKAAELMTRTGHTVSLKVAKQGAIYHGLAKLLSQPSPILQQRGGPRVPGSPGQRVPPNHEEAPPPYYTKDGREYGREPGMVSGKYRPGIQQNQLARSSPSLNSDISNSDRQRATSTSNVRDMRDEHMPPPNQGQGYKQNVAADSLDSRSKSTSNLNQADPYGRHDPGQIRPAASTSVLPRNQQPRDYRSEGPNGDPRGYDPRSRLDSQQQQQNGNVNYENQPRVMDPSRQKPQQPNRRYDNSSPNYSRTSNDSSGNKWSPPHQSQNVPNKRTSSSSSSSLQREESRPRSAYMTHPERPEFNQSRPKSEEFEVNRVREWQERNERSNLKPQLSPNSTSSDRRPGPPSAGLDPQRQPGYNQRGQPGFYENTSPRPGDGGMPHERHEIAQPKPKPAATHKPGLPKVQHIEVSRSKVPTWQDSLTRQKKPTHTAVHRQPADTGRPNQSNYFDQQRSPQEHQQRPDNRQENRPNNAHEQRPNQSNQRTDPRMEQRQDPRNDRQDPRIDHRQDPRTDQWSDPRAEQRLSQHIDPRAEQRLSQHIDPRSDPRNEQRLSQHIDPRSDPRNEQRLSQHIDPRSDPRNEQRLSQHIDPRSDPRNEQRLSQHIDPRLQDSFQQNNLQPHQQGPQPSPGSNQQPQYGHNPQMSYYDPQPNKNNRYSAGQDLYVKPEVSVPGQELPPPPDNPPELPPPPTEVEELPPPPPPPSDYRLEQTLKEEQERLMQQLNTQFDGMDPYRDPGYRQGPAGDSRYNYPDPAYEGYNPNGYSPPTQPSDPYSAQPNYQNINRFHEPSNQADPRYDPRNSAANQSGPAVPPNIANLHPRYNQYDQALAQPNQEPVNIRNDISGARKPPVAAKPVKNTNVKAAAAEHPDKNAKQSSAWDRDEKEKEKRKQEMTVKQMRDHEIADLEGRKPYLTPQEQDRLKKLRLEQEFQRRVEEVDNRGEDEDDDSDNEVSERVMQREQLIQNVQDDLLKTKLRLEEMSQRHRYEEFEREKDRMERLQRKLEIFQKERDEQKARQKKKQEMREKKQQEYLQRQREMRERQRREFEDNKRMLMQEEEKNHQRKMEELRKKKEQERQQMREMQEARDAEEARLRAEARKQEEEFNRQQRQAQAERERQEQQRQQDIRVKEEQRRLDALAQQNQTSTPYYPPYTPSNYKGYAQPAQPNYNYQPQPVNNHIDAPYEQGQSLNAPPPPERKSSYEYVQHHHQQSLRQPEMQGDAQQANYMNSSAYRGGGQPPPTHLNNSSMRQYPEGNNNNAGVPKKSVSFNTQLETQINTYSVSSEDDPSQHPSYSSYRSSSSSQDPQSPNDGRYPYGGNATLDHGPNDVFQTPPQHNNAPSVSYKVTDTPGVVGAQEVYRDPRFRIQAKKAQQPLKGNTTERMSFRDKMKFFAKEAGENTPQEKPKASRVQRTIESQMNGQ